MKSLQDCKEFIGEWKRKGHVGTLMFYAWPKAEGFEVMEERVVKVKEMDPDVAAAFIYFMESLGIQKGEVLRDSNNAPDRVKFVRSIND